MPTFEKWQSMGMDVKQCFDEIEMLDKEEFHQKILRGVAATSEFSALVSIGVRFLTEEQKKSICSQLEDAGIPAKYESYPQFNEDLQDIGRYIASRAVQVR